jgi:hypothetical protein
LAKIRRVVDRAGGLRYEHHALNANDIVPNIQVLAVLDQLNAEQVEKARVA